MIQLQLLIDDKWETVSTHDNERIAWITLGDDNVGYRTVDTLTGNVLTDKSRNFRRTPVDSFELKSRFTEDFFEEFQFDAEFRTLFEKMARGLTPYEAIEHLYKSKKEVYKQLEKAVLLGKPAPIFVPNPDKNKPNTNPK